MKRSWGVHLFICFVLGMAIGSLLLRAIQDNSITSGVQTVMAIVALGLNVPAGQTKIAMKSNVSSMEHSKIKNCVPCYFFVKY